MFTWLLKARLHCLAPLPELHSLASRALPAAQVPITTLPDELLGGILRRAWADRPLRPAAAEVRAAAGLASVCRRVRELLRAAPLPLALEPAQAGRVEGAKLCIKPDAELCEDALWERPLLDDFLARHGGTLLQLSGVPLQLVASVSQKERPALDLSGLRLTKLGIKCCGEEGIIGKEWGECLWPEYLPSALEELDLLGLCQNYLSGLAWASRSGAGVAGRLPRLHTLCFRAHDIASKLTKYNGMKLCIDYQPLLEGFTSLPHLKGDGSGADVYCTHAAVFDRVRSARIVSGGRLHLWVGMHDAATIAERLCRAGLQAAELCAKHDRLHVYRAIQGAEFDNEQEKSFTRELVLEMISRCGDRFAVEVGFPAMLPDWRHQDKARLNRLTWRCWPAHGAPDLPAARAAHERARAWAAAGGPPYYDDRCEDHDEEHEVFG